MKKRLKVFLWLSGTVSLFLAIFYFYHVPEIPAEVLIRKYKVKPSQFLKVEGMNVHYRMEGPESDTLPLVLLHGTFSSLYTWNSWTALLKKRRLIIRLDLPGFGLTGPHPKDDYRLENYLDFLQSFLSALEVKQCILVGNSLGGEIAWRYALNHPKQVKKLVLINSAGYPVEVKELPLVKIPLSYLWLRIPLIRELSVKFTTPQVIRNSLEYLYGEPEKVTDALVELYFDMTNREGNREAITERMESFNRTAPFERIPSIKTPALILWGEKDRLIPVDNGIKFHKDLPNSQLFIYPEAGHMPMEEIPRQSVEAVIEFIGKKSSAVVNNNVKL